MGFSGVRFPKTLQSEGRFANLTGTSHKDHPVSQISPDRFKEVSFNRLHYVNFIDYSLNNS